MTIASNATEQSKRFAIETVQRARRYAEDFRTLAQRAGAE